MKIGLDYDDTITLDPPFWRDFIALAKAYGHEVVCVSLRFNTLENSREVNETLGHKIPVVLCDHEYKEEKAEKKGLKIDVWIDDLPETIRRAR